jgi:hypothetical protein
MQCSIVSGGNAGFFIRLAGRTLRFPAWLPPGDVEVVRREERDGAFSFTLRVVDPGCGAIIRQIALSAIPCSAADGPVSGPGPPRQATRRS